VTIRPEDRTGTICVVQTGCSGTVFEERSRAEVEVLGRRRKELLPPLAPPCIAGMARAEDSSLLPIAPAPTSSERLTAIQSQDGRELLSKRSRICAP